MPSAKDPVDGPSYEESLALVQTMLGENSRAISILGPLLKTPYSTFLYLQAPITPALLSSIRCGTRCVPIRLSKSSARKTNREPARFRSAIDSNGRTIWIVDAHRGDGKRFVVHAEEKLTAFLEIESATLR